MRVPWPAVLVVVLAGPTTTASTPLQQASQSPVGRNLEWYQAYDAGLRALGREDWATAISLLNQAIGPHDGTRRGRNESGANKGTGGGDTLPYYLPHHYLALAYLASGDLVRARAEFDHEAARKVVLASPQASRFTALGERIEYEEGIRAVQAGRWQEGIDLLERSAAIGDTSRALSVPVNGPFTPHYYLALARQGTGELDKAQAEAALATKEPLGAAEQTRLASLVNPLSTPPPSSTPTPTATAQATPAPGTTATPSPTASTAPSLTPLSTRRPSPSRTRAAQTATPSTVAPTQRPPLNVSASLLRVGVAELLQGNAERAARVLEEARSTAFIGGARWRAASAFLGAAHATLARRTPHPVQSDDYRKALAAFQEAGATAREVLRREYFSPAILEMIPR